MESFFTSQPEIPYNQTVFTKRELEAHLKDHVSLLELNRVLSAYELAESVHEHQRRNDGSPYFYHSTRVCKILCTELRITDADVLCAAILHDVLEDSETITHEVLEYNFGEYVSYIVETLTKDLERQEMFPEDVEREHLEILKKASVDCLLIRLTARLDNFRCLGFNLKRNPIRYINETSENYLPLADHFKSERLYYIVREIKKERNKFLG
jgi:GTP diphosphokinase / guanosine-3',5'-bis(diphosphate) 3'-diphosphatase